MKTNTKLTMIYCLLLPALAFSGWYFGKTSNSHKLDTYTLNHTIDLVVTNLHFYEFDEQGQLTRDLKTSRIEHIPYKNQFVLTRPQMVFRSEEKKFWHLSARHATTSEGLDNIVFTEDVVLNQPEPAQDDIAMYTNILTYLPKKAQAFTNSPVLFKQQGHILQSQGMRANLDKNQIKLKHAHAQIQPKHA